MTAQAIGFKRGPSQSLPRATSLSGGRDRLSAAATLARASASTSAGLVDGSGAVLRPGVVAPHDAVPHHFPLGPLDRETYIEEFVYNYGDRHRALPSPKPSGWA